MTPEVQNKRKQIVTIVVLSTVLGVNALFVLSYRPTGRVVDNVYVGSLNESGKSAEQVAADLKVLADRRSLDSLSLAFTALDGNMVRLSPKVADLGGTLDNSATMNLALKVGKSDTVFQRIKQRFQRRQKTVITTVWSLERKTLFKYMRRHIANRMRKEYRDARWYVGNNGPEIRPEVVGTSLDMEKTLRLVQAGMQSAVTSDIHLPVENLKPNILTTDLSDIKEVINEFSTSYNQNGNRGRNIEVACKKINGTVLKPGNIFSYNKVVGPRESENGFKLAPVIIRGRLEPGIGGGVCQTSTTLYNAVLLSGLKVVRRSHHAFPVHYVPSGRDATVAYGAIDFRFANNQSSPIAIYASSAGGKVTMKIYGKKPTGREIQIERHVLREWGPDTQIVTDSTIPTGRRVTMEGGHEGIRVNVFRRFLENGVQVRKDLVSSDTYDPVTRVVALGTKKLSSLPIKGPKPPSSPSKPVSFAPHGGQLILHLLAATYPSAYRN